MTKLKVSKQTLHDVINAVNDLPGGSLPEDVQAWILQTAKDELHACIAEETSQQINTLSQGFAQAQEKEELRKKAMTAGKKPQFSLRRLFR